MPPHPSVHSTTQMLRESGTGPRHTATGSVTGEVLALYQIRATSSWEKETSEAVTSLLRVSVSPAKRVVQLSKEAPQLS